MHTSAASSRLNWRPRRFKWTRPFRAKDEIWFLLLCRHISIGLYLEGHEERTATGSWRLKHLLMQRTDVNTVNRKDSFWLPVKSSSRSSLCGERMLRSWPQSGFCSSSLAVHSIGQMHQSMSELPVLRKVRWVSHKGRTVIINTFLKSVWQFADMKQ